MRMLILSSYCEVIHNKSYPMFVPDFKILEAVDEKSLMKKNIGEKDKWTNKGNDKLENADSLLHN